MIKVTDLSYGFPQKDLYNKICFEIEQGDHAVLIGSNGTGKTTLVDMLISPEEYLYEGKIARDEGIRIGYVSQFVSHEGNQSVYDFLSQPFVEMLARADEEGAMLAEAEDMEAACERYQKCLDEIEAVDAYNYDSNLHKQLALAGLTQIEENTVDKISGGEFKLLSIIRNMMLRPQLLVMDEPDVFLDFENLVGLSKLINSYTGTVLVISHNRLLLSQCFNKILHLENEELQEFPGTFAEYNLSMLETKVAMQEQATKDSEWIDIQQKLVERMRAEASRIANSGKGKQLKARVSYLERLQARRTKDPFVEEHDYAFAFPTWEEPEAGVLLQVADYRLAYDRELLHDVNFSVNRGEKVAIVGANGTGKSSILRDLEKMLKAQDEKVACFAQIFDTQDGEKMSGGERNLKQLQEMAKTDAHVLLLDEPTSHLDIYAMMALEDALRDYKGTVLMVSHDFYTVTGICDRILLVEDETVREMSGRAFRKMVYKKYFDSDVFEQEKERKEREIRVNSLLKQGKYMQAKEILS